MEVKSVSVEEIVAGVVREVHTMAFGTKPLASLTFSSWNQIRETAAQAIPPPEVLLNFVNGDKR